MAAESPVRLYASDDRRLAPRLGGKLQDAIKKAGDNLSFSQDWADFKYRNGYRSGLLAALSLCDEIEGELDGR